MEIRIKNISSGNIKMIKGFINSVNINKYFKILKIVDLTIVDGKLIIIFENIKKLRIYKIIVKEDNNNEKYFCKIDKLIIIYSPLLEENNLDKKIIFQFINELNIFIAENYFEIYSLLKENSFTAIELGKQYENNLGHYNLQDILSKYFYEIDNLNILEHIIKENDKSVNYWIISHNKKKYFLKAILTYVNNYYLLNYKTKKYQCDLYKYFADKISIPRLYDSNSNNNFYINQGSFFYLYEYIDIIPHFKYNDQLILDLVNQLSALHGFKSKNIFKNELLGCSEFINEINCISKILPEIKIDIEKMRKYDGRTGWCHFDLNPDNIVLTKENKLYLIDFEQLNYNFVILDIANLIVRFLHAKRDFDTIKSIITEYFNENINIKNEYDNLPTMTKVMCCYIYYRKYKYDIDLLMKNKSNLLNELASIKSFYDSY